MTMNDLLSVRSIQWITLAARRVGWLETSASPQTLNYAERAA